MSEQVNGGTHFVAGAATAGLGLWGLSAAGIGVDPTVMLAGSLAAGMGALGPDIDHSRSTISRGLPAELLAGGVPLLVIPLVFGAVVWISAGPAAGPKLLQPFEPLLRWGLVMALPAAVLMIASRLAFEAFGHRGVTHSLGFAVGSVFVVAAACSGFGVSWWYGLLYAWGWLTHLALDSLTTDGVPQVLWPSEYLVDALLPFANDPTLRGGGSRASGAYSMVALLAVTATLSAAGWYGGVALKALVPAAPTVLAGAAVPVAPPTRVPGASGPALALKRLREADSATAAALVHPDSPVIGTRGGLTTYTWDYLEKSAPNRVAVKTITITLDSSGNIVGVN